MTQDRLRRGVFTSVPDLIEAIDQYIAVHNEKPKPFVWTAKANDILKKVMRANRQLSSKQNAALNYAALIFVTSALVLVVEIVAARLIASFVGVSLYFWMAIIGVVLAGLLLGNWIGGVWADRGANKQTAGVVLLLASLSVFAVL